MVGAGSAGIGGATAVRTAPAEKTVELYRGGRGGKEDQQYDDYGLNHVHLH